MAWHILHGLLEQVRVHSTFSGKLWIVLMFVFRIVVVARIGDHVYHDEQSSFVCNTLTPGCNNVCFNIFSPISQLRFWSLMVLVVTIPSALFFMYAGHKIHHAHVKFPLPEQESSAKSGDNDFDSRSGSTFMKGRNRGPPPLYPNATAPPMYVVRSLSTRKDEMTEKFNEEKSKDAMRRRKRRRANKSEEEKDMMLKRRGLATNNDYSNAFPTHDSNWFDHNSRLGYPIYADRHGRRVEYIQQPVKPYDEIKANKQRKMMLENPQLYRAYWWHVILRTILEAGFVIGQYFLYGFKVPELFECTRYPCVKTVDCFVSRPMEKTCLLWLMFVLGAIACLLSFGEMYTLGWDRLKYAFCCQGPKVTYEEKRRKLATLKHSVHEQQHEPKPHKDEILMTHAKGYISSLSLDSESSETTIESV